MNAPAPVPTPEEPQPMLMITDENILSEIILARAAPQPMLTITDTGGEVYENDALLMGFIFPLEYRGKCTIFQHEGGGFAVIHTATFELLGYADVGEPFGLLFTVERRNVSFGEDVNHNLIKPAVFLFQTDRDFYRDFYYLRRPDSVMYDESMPGTWQTTEYKLLNSDDMINKIIASAYLTTQKK